MPPRDVTLVVCEGSETEPGYLREARDALRLSTASVDLVGLGAAPSTVVDHAVRKFEQSPHYERVYCVFDRDEHESYSASVDRCLATRKKNENGKIVQFRPITSWPCFEYWLLLHFKRSDAPIGPAGGRTAAQVACSQLRQFIPDYTKSSGGNLRQTEGQIVQAASDAYRFYQGAGQNPHTTIFRLLSFFAAISSNSEVKWREGLADLARKCEEV